MELAESVLPPIFMIFFNIIFKKNFSNFTDINEIKRLKLDQNLSALLYKTGNLNASVTK